MGPCSPLFHLFVGGALVCGNLLSYLFDAGWPVVYIYAGVSFAASVALLTAGLLMHKRRNLAAATWQQQYCSPPTQLVALGVFYLCFWGFVGHVLQLIIDRHCNVCDGLIGKTWPWPEYALVERYFPSAFWVHASTSAIIALLAPLQFTETIRKWNSFQAHRWIGRTVLLASCVHQAGATYLTISNLFFNRHNDFKTSTAANRLYALGFVPFNIYTVTATVQGWRCARLRRINEHIAWMHRLGAVWIIFVIEFRLVNPILMMIDVQWGLAVHLSVMALCLIPLEVYIKESGRISWSAQAPYRCPFDFLLSWCEPSRRLPRTPAEAQI